jgi:hypothetical protein
MQIRKDIIIRSLHGVHMHTQNVADCSLVVKIDV